MDVSVFAGGRIPIPALPGDILGILDYSAANKIPMTLLPFKVPNHVSFMPNTFGMRLEKKLPPPPYKKKSSLFALA
jgi:hypothetical protein